MTALDRDHWAAHGVLPHHALADAQVGPRMVADTLRDMAAMVERDLVGRQVYWDTLRLERLTPGLPALQPTDLLRLTVEVQAR